MYIRVLCTIIYQSDDLALSASDKRTVTWSSLICSTSKFFTLSGFDFLAPP